MATFAKKTSNSGKSAPKGKRSKGLDLSTLSPEQQSRLMELLAIDDNQPDDNDNQPDDSKGLREGNSGKRLSPTKNPLIQGKATGFMAAVAAKKQGAVGTSDDDGFATLDNTDKAAFFDEFSDVEGATLAMLVPDGKGGNQIFRLANMKVNTYNGAESAVFVSQTNNVGFAFVPGQDSTVMIESESGDIYTLRLGGPVYAMVKKVKRVSR